MDVICVVLRRIGRLKSSVAKSKDCDGLALENVSGRGQILVADCQIDAFDRWHVRLPQPNRRHNHTAGNSPSLLAFGAYCQREGIAGAACRRALHRVHGRAIEDSATALLLRGVLAQIFDKHVGVREALDGALRQRSHARIPQQPVPVVAQVKLGIVTAGVAFVD